MNINEQIKNVISQNIHEEDKLKLNFNLLKANIVDLILKHSTK